MATVTSETTTKTTLSIEGLTQNQYDLIVRLVGSISFEFPTNDLFADLVLRAKDTWDLVDSKGNEIQAIYPINQKRWNY